MLVVVYVVAALGWMVLVAAKPASQRVGFYSDDFCCQWGICMSPDRVCDGIVDCPFTFEDEIGCTTSTYNSQTSHCPDNKYECTSGLCIPEYFVCDGTTDCPVYGDDEVGCTSHDSSTITTSLSTSPPPFACEGTFDYIYDRCVLVNPFTFTTWDEARYLCQKLNSDLVVLDDFSFYSKLLHYINSRGLENHSYWVGARDQQEGVWRWIDDTLVHVGAPLWALYGCTDDYHVEPRPSEAGDQDCGYLDTSRGLYMSDASCDEEFAAICQGRTIGKDVKKTKAKEPAEKEEVKDDGDEEDTAEEVSEGTRKEKNESKEKETVTIEENDEKEDKVKARNGDKEEERKEVEEEEEEETNDGASVT